MGLLMDGWQGSVLGAIMGTVVRERARQGMDDTVGRQEQDVE